MTEKIKACLGYPGYFISNTGFKWRWATKEEINNRKVELCQAI